MEVNRLLGDEIIYELNIRGLPVYGTVAENRATLRGALRLERDGVSPWVDSNTGLPPQEELDICIRKLTSLFHDIQTFDLSNKDNEYKRIYSRLCHVQNRLKRISVINSDMEQVRKENIVQCLVLIDALSRAKDIVRDGRGNPRNILDEENRLEGSLIDLENPLLPANVSPQPHQTAGGSQQNRSQQVPQWEQQRSQAQVQNSTMVQMGLNALEEVDEIRNHIHRENIQMEQMLRVTSDPSQQMGNEEIQQRSQPSRIQVLPPSQHIERRFYEPLPSTFMNYERLVHTSDRDPREEDRSRLQNLPPPTYFSNNVVASTQKYSRRGLPNYENLQQPSCSYGHDVQPPGCYGQNVGASSQQYKDTKEVENRFKDLHLPSSSGNDVVSKASQLPFIDISRWRIQYDGESSVANFLERIEELRVSRGVSKDLLLRSAPELFTKEALIWFRTQRFGSWDELTQCLRENFQPYDYEFDLMEEIRRRTQGAKERVVTYIASMENLFNKLGTNKPSEWTRMKLIQRNLLPYQQTQLALHRVENISELIRLCRMIEETAVRAQKYAPPPTNYRQLLEPELAYHRSTCGTVFGPSVSAIDDNRRTEMSYVEPQEAPKETISLCWNCQKTGHRFRKCTEPRRIFCFRCGHANVIANSCPDCKSKNFKRRGQ